MSPEANIIRDHVPVYIGATVVRCMGKPECDWKPEFTPGGDSSRNQWAEHVATSLRAALAAADPEAQP